jgi:hypothetical protein
VTSTKLPYGLGPIAEELSRRVELFREHKGWDRGTAAKHFGLPKALVTMIEEQNHIPAQHECERIARCMFEGADYSKTRLPAKSRGAKAREKPTKWHKGYVYLDSSRHKQLQQMCWRWGISQTELLSIAAERFLDSEPFLGQLERACERLRAANLAELQRVNPTALEILKGDMKIALEQEVTNEPPQPFPIAAERIIEEPANWDDTDWELV